MSLADQANDAGVCWPGVASLSERTCLSERTVQRAIRALEEAQFLACALGAMKSNRYTLNVPRLKQLEREREAAKEAERAGAAALQQASLDLAERVEPGVSMGDMVTGCHGVTGDMVSPQGCHGVTQTVIEPIHIPPTPQAPLGGQQGSAEAPGDSGDLASFRDWLASVQASGQDAIAEDDEVFDYAATVGLPRDFVVLCWQEFKHRQLMATKRQRDWRQRFRECVRTSSMGLWVLAAGQTVRLSTAGEQAARFHAQSDQPEDDE